MTPILQSTLTCPDCGMQTVETMPTDACVYFHTCSRCGARLRPKSGDCCIFCSYGSVPCPPIQESGGGGCSAEIPASIVPDSCSLEPGAFRERMGEIATLMRTFGGVMAHMQGGMELHFKAGEGVRTALETLAEKERACCTTLKFTVREGAGTISLFIEGMAGDCAAIDTLAARLMAAQASAELRTNVYRPDWSKITLPKAREVLQRRLLAHPEGVARWTELEAVEDDALTAVLRHFARHGRAPAADDVARASGRSADEVQQALEKLRVRDLVVLDQSRISILAAYPFTDYSTGHRVTLRGQTMNSLCVIDALGAGAMCEAETSITSACAHCDKPVHIVTSHSGKELGAVEPEKAVVWYTLAFDGCAAQSCCPGTVFFCDDNHLAAWRADKGAQMSGDRLSMAEALEIGIALFEPLLRSA